MTLTTTLAGSVFNIDLLINKFPTKSILQFLLLAETTRQCGT